MEKRSGQIAGFQEAASHGTGKEDTGDIDVGTLLAILDSLDKETKRAVSLHMFGKEVTDGAGTLDTSTDLQPKTVLLCVDESTYSKSTVRFYARCMHKAGDEVLLIHCPMPSKVY